MIVGLAYESVDEKSLSKRGGLCAVGVPLPKERANHHTFTLPPEMGAQIRLFGAQPDSSADSSAAPQWGRRAKSGAW